MNYAMIRIMEQWTIGASGLATMVACLVFWGLRIKRADKRSHQYALPATVFTALTGLLAVMWWIKHTEPTVSRIDVLKAGGIAATAIVALYALWLNDRRRRIEEDRRDIEAQRREIEHDRQQLETRKANHEQQKVGNEQFARAVELLGHVADQVRVGALHALHSQAAAEPARIQTVLDVLCAYLRRPFDHDRHREHEGNPIEEESENDPIDHYMSDEDQVTNPSSRKDEYVIVERERQVRLTAQRLISKTLHSSPGDRFFDLDLTGATLENFTLDGGNVGELTLSSARVFRGFSIIDTHIEKVNMKEARFHSGELQFNSVKVAGDLDLRLTKQSLQLRMTSVKIGGHLILAGAELNWGGRFDNVELAGDFYCPVWVGRGLIMQHSKVSGNALLSVDEGHIFFRDDDGEMLAIHDTDVRPEERNLSHLEARLPSGSLQG
jgi:hypothetical protein